MRRHHRPAFAEGRFHIPGELLLAHVGTIGELNLMILVMAVGVDDLRVGEQEEAFLAGLHFPVVHHLGINAPGVVDGNIIGIVVTAFGVILVEIVGARLVAGPEIPQVHREDGV